VVQGRRSISTPWKSPTKTHTSERWPASNRTLGQHQIGILGRNASESAYVAFVSQAGADRLSGVRRHWYGYMILTWVEVGYVHCQREV
jgi:hypothetical protein